MMTYIVPFLFGITIGSFLNVCIYRIPRGESIIFPPSHCPQCGFRLKPRDLFPILSFLVLWGRCRKCNAKISRRYPLIEVVTGILFTLIVIKYGLTLQALFISLFSAGLMIIFFIDWDFFLIPNKVNLVLFMIGLIYHIVVKPFNIANAIFAFFGIGIFFLLLQILFRGGLGGGDVKLASILGLWLGWPDTALAIFLGSFIGSVIGIYLIILKLKKRKDPIPYGPFLVLGTLIVLFMGEIIWGWYLNLIF